VNALVLVGSPKGRNSSSFLLGSKLAEDLRKHGVPVREELVHPALRTEDGTLRLLDAVDASDLVVISFPLYVDSLPSPLTRLLERVAVRRAASASPGAPRLAVVVQCGFPEAHQCDTAVAICRLFAGRTGMRWAGALAMGMGGQLGRGFRKLPGGGRNILEAIDRTAESLAKGGDVPGEATALFARPLVPRWVYTLFGNLGWRVQMRENRTRRPITYRPHPQD
jgi:hypothetical protein